MSYGWLRMHMRCCLASVRMAERIGGEWDREIAAMDLTVWQDIVHAGRAVLPSYEELAVRWGWVSKPTKKAAGGKPAVKRVRGLMDDDFWRDPRKGDPRDSWSGRRVSVPDVVQPENDEEEAKGSDGKEESGVSGSEGNAEGIKKEGEGQQKGTTRVGSQNTGTSTGTCTEDTDTGSPPAPPPDKPSVSLSGIKQQAHELWLHHVSLSVAGGHRRPLADPGQHPKAWKIEAAIRDIGADAMRLVVEWAHFAGTHPDEHGKPCERAAFLRDSGHLNRGTPYTGKRTEYRDLARAWDAAGRPGPGEWRPPSSGAPARASPSRPDSTPEDRDRRVLDLLRSRHPTPEHPC